MLCVEPKDYEQIWNNPTLDQTDAVSISVSKKRKAHLILFLYLRLFPLNPLVPQVLQRKSSVKQLSQVNKSNVFHVNALKPMILTLPCIIR